jgi:DNA-binding response OmpR family regulator
MNKQFNKPDLGPEPTNYTPQRGLKIFIIEDESMVTMLIEDILQDLGYEVAGNASRIEEAMGKISTLTFDAAILDVNLNGHETFKIAEKLESDGVPFLFATGYGVHGIPERFHNVAVLPKPFRENDMENALKAVFSSSFLRNGRPPTAEIR